VWTPSQIFVEDMTSSSLLGTPHSDVAIRKPFLRWAGGKTWLIPTLRTILEGGSFKGYHEPFVGAGAVFLNMTSGMQRVSLSDLNAELIDTYQAIKKDHSRVLTNLNNWSVNRDKYNEIRQKRYTDPFMIAARMIYLNFHSYNGIYRVNSSGQYNVPFGRREGTEYPAREVACFSAALQNVKLTTGDFSNSLKHVRAGDLVYIDPPYTVSHNNNGFIAYNQKLFSFDDQVRLRSFTEEITARDAYFIMSNAHHDSIAALYMGRHLEKRVVHRANKIGGKAAIRGRTTELVITNIK
jgi:DNA adenine methylase